MGKEYLDKDISKITCLKIHKPMNVLITGTEDENYNYNLLLKVISNSQFNINEITCCEKEFVGNLGEKFGREFYLKINYYNKLGENIIKNIDSAIILWDGKSEHINNIIEMVRNRGVPLVVFNSKQEVTIRE